MWRLAELPQAEGTQVRPAAFPTRVPTERLSHLTTATTD